MNPLRTGLLWLLWPAALGCPLDSLRSEDRSANAEVLTAARAQLEPARVEAPYPHGAWRLAQRSELQNVVLWVSHLLVRHQDVRGRGVRFCRAAWTSMPPAPARSREQALTLARRIAAEAQASPDRFSSLVSQYSEDITTAERGGSLGGLRAVELLEWPQVLDAMAVLRPGEVSSVVETEYGFHIFYRRAPPEPQRVSGSHIVVGHAQAQFLALLRGGPELTRSREDALRRARSLHAQAVAAPSRFGELAATSSEHLDAVLGGDMGEWLTVEPSEYPTHVDVLSQLAVGEVAAPVETLFGWEIIMRTENREREVYAMTPVEVRFELDPSGKGVSASAAQQRAQGLANVLREQPERFEELQRLECCERVVQLPDGKGWPPLLAALKQLQLHQISPQPIRYGFSYVIPKRIEPRPQPARPAASYELPTPDVPGLAAAFGSQPVDRLREELNTLLERAHTELGLSADTVARLQQANEEACRADLSQPLTRLPALDRFQAQMLHLLGPSLHASYMGLARTHFARLPMNPL